jgi:hypothetical protein
MTRPLEEQIAEFKVYEQVYELQIAGLLKVMETLQERYGNIPELPVLNNVVKILKVLYTEYAAEAYREGRELLQDKNNPDAIAQYAEIQAITGVKE